MNETKHFSIIPPPILRGVIELLAAGTSVATYHPLRTIATQLIAGIGRELSLKVLYRGFCWNAFSAHQLFVMGSTHIYLKSMFVIDTNKSQLIKQLALAVIAGVASIPTAAPCELLSIQRQLGREIPNYHYRTLYRGCIPFGMRQIGLTGMFVYPELIINKFKGMFSNCYQNNEKPVKVFASLLGGFAVALSTQIPEVARVLMQADIKREKYKTTRSALKQAITKEIVSQKGMQLLGIRLGIVTMATIVMNLSRDIYTYLFFGGRNHG